MAAGGLQQKEVIGSADMKRAIYDVIRKKSRDRLGKGEDTDPKRIDRSVCTENTKRSLICGG
jgi:hypothetical protein